MKKIITIVFLVVVLSLGALFVSKWNDWYVIRRSDQLSPQDTMAFVEIKKMFDTEERNPKSDFIRIYFIPPFAKKSVFQLTFENKNWVVLRKNLINDSQFWGPGRDSVKQSDFEIEALQTSEAWNQLAQFLYNSNAKYFESEIRIHPITGRDVIFFDEHLWYLEIRKGGSSNWTVWYDGSENFYQIESVVKAFAPGKL